MGVWRLSYIDMVNVADGESRDVAWVIMGGTLQDSGSRSAKRGRAGSHFLLKVSG